MASRFAVTFRTSLTVKSHSVLEMVNLDIHVVETRGTATVNAKSVMDLALQFGPFLVDSPAYVWYRPNSILTPLC